MMKNILVLLLSIFPYIIHAQGLYKNNIFSYNNTIEFSLHSGATGRKQDVELNVLGFSFSLYGFYVDYVFWSRAEDIIRYTDLGEDKTESFHIGYQFPITRWLKITPLVGYSDVENMGYYYYKFDSYHKLYKGIVPKKKDFGFDYGAQVTFNVYSNENVNLMLHGTFTKYCEYCGIGVGIKL